MSKPISVQISVKFGTGSKLIAIFPTKIVWNIDEGQDCCDNM